MPVLAFAQESPDLLNDSIQGMLDSHPYRFLIFRVEPELDIESGYDSNALSVSNSGLGAIVGDYYTSIAPGGDFALKLGHRGYFTIDESVDFLYYKDLDQLRDIYNTTDGKFITGSRRLLLTLEGSYIKKKSRINSETDIPSKIRTISGDAALDFALRARTTLNFKIANADNQYSRIKGTPLTQPLPPDFRNTAFTAGVSELFGQTTTVTVNGTKGYDNFKDTGFNHNLKDKTDYWGTQGGFNFKGQKLTGVFLVGYEVRQSRSPDHPNLRNSTFNIDLTWLLKKKYHAGVFANRDREPSTFTPEGYRLTTEGGFKGTLPLKSRFFFDGTALVGKNQYSEIEPARITKDNYREVDIGFNTIIIQGVKDLVFRTGVIFYKRESDYAPFNKDRTTFEVGIQYKYGP